MPRSTPSLLGSLALVACVRSVPPPSVWDPCTPSQTGTFELPAHAGYAHFHFAAATAARLEVEVEIHNDPGSEVGLYYAPFNGAIDDTGFYAGLQTNLARPGAGGVGKGLLFSRWGSLDSADTRPEDDGYIEIGTHEGEFVGVRRPYAWTPGRYTLTVARGAADGAADWFDYTVTAHATGETIPLGSLRFPRSDPQRPATIRLTGGVTTFVEVYAGATRYEAVPDWTLDSWTRADGQPPARVVSDYPAFPYAEFPNVDVALSPDGHAVRMAFGAGTRRCHPPGTLDLPHG